MKFLQPDFLPIFVERGKIKKKLMDEKINNLTIKEVERRLKPLKLEKEGEENEQILWDAEELPPEGLEEDEEVPAITVLRSMRTRNGYIGEKESLSELREESRKSLESFGFNSSKELTLHLRNVLTEFDKLSQSKREKEESGAETFQISFTPQNLPHSISEKFPVSEQKLLVTRFVLRGEPKFDPFLDLHNFSEGNCWNDEFEVYSEKLDLSLKLRGGSLKMMEEYCFFEGSSEGRNEFYNPVERILSVLIGQFVSRKVVEDEKRRQMSKLSSLERTKKSLQSQLAEKKDIFKRGKEALKKSKKSKKGSAQSEGEMDELELEEMEGDILYLSSEINLLTGEIQSFKKTISLLDTKLEELKN